MTGRPRVTTGRGETAETGVMRGGGTGGAAGLAPGPDPGPGAKGGAVGAGAGAEIERIIVREEAETETGVRGGRDTEQSPRPVKMTGRTMLLTTPS